MSSIFSKRNSEIIAESGDNNYSYYRVPGISMNQRGTIFCYYEGIKKENNQIIQKGLFYRRSTNRGESFEEPVLMKQGRNVHNILLLGGKENKVFCFTCDSYSNCIYRYSIDDGNSWSEEINITPVFQAVKSTYDWNYFSLSNGHGLRLNNGRLLIGGWMSCGINSHLPSCFITIYSDDNGNSWQTGSIFEASAVFSNPTESSFVQLDDNCILATFRHSSKPHRRAFGISRDCGCTWSEPYLAHNIYDPICSAALCALPDNRLVLAHCNYENSEDKPTAVSRQNLTLCISNDWGKTWMSDSVLEKYAGYSDLLYLPSKNELLCFYENTWLDNNCFTTQYLSLCHIKFSP